MNFKDRLTKTNLEDIPKVKVIPELNDWSLAIGLVKPNSKVLSCGCGAGREVSYLVNILGCEVVAIDDNSIILDSSKEIEPRAYYILGDYEDYLNIGKFDFITCLGRTINHLKTLEQRQRFIRQSYHNLKPGGKLIIETSHKFSSFRKLYRSVFLWNYYPFPRQIDKWFKYTNFKVNKIKTGESVIILAIKE